MKWTCQEIGARNGILNRQVDANASGGRHGVRGIANAQQARSVPAPQAVNPHRKQLNLLPILQFRNPSVQVRSKLQDAVSELLQAASFDVIERALPDDQPGLEIFAAIDRD